MSSISRGRRSGSAGIRRVYPGAPPPGRVARPAVLLWAVLPAFDAKTSPPAGQLLGELLPIVAEISGVLDPEQLLPAIAGQLRRIVDYRILDIFLPEPDGTLVPAYVEGYDKAVAGRLRIRPGQGIVGAAAEQKEPLFVPDVS